MKEYCFKKKSLEHYSVIDRPGTYIVRVANVNTNLYEEDGYPRYIISLKAATTIGFELCLELMGNKETIDFSYIRNCFLTGSIWETNVSHVSELPTKNEEVIATFDYMDEILRCINITLIPRKRPDKFNLNSMCNSRKLLLALLE